MYLPRPESRVPSEAVVLRNLGGYWRIEYSLFKHVSTRLDHGKQGSTYQDRSLSLQFLRGRSQWSKRVLLGDLAHMPLKGMSWVLTNVSLAPPEDGKGIQTPRGSVFIYIVGRCSSLSFILL